MGLVKSLKHGGSQGFFAQTSAGRLNTVFVQVCMVRTEKVGDEHALPHIY
jgi:hypothetical protein